MEVGLVGLPYCGKSTLFSALTGAPTPPTGAMKPTVGVANVPDTRLDLIASYIPPKKITPATLQVVDIPGLNPGDGSAVKALDHIRKVDAICHVVPCFSGDGMPVRSPSTDIENIDTEIILADLAVVESALPKAQRSARSRDAKAMARVALLEKIGPALEEGRPIRAMLAAGEIKEDSELLALKEFGMVSAKKVLYVANVGDEDVGGESEAAAQVRAAAESQGMEFVAVCARLEAELNDLDPEDRMEMLEGLGLESPALPTLAAALYRLLGLQSFYTAGEKEVRAWTVRNGSSAREAAGAIHSDIERGFIRAEIYSVGDLDEHKSEQAIRTAGRLRVEGKEYVMQDADVVHFLFNV